MWLYLFNCMFKCNLTFFQKHTINCAVLTWWYLLHFYSVANMTVEVVLLSYFLCDVETGIVHLCDLLIHNLNNVWRWWLKVWNSMHTSRYACLAADQFKFFLFALESAFPPSVLSQYLLLQWPSISAVAFHFYSTSTSAFNFYSCIVTVHFYSGVTFLQLLKCPGPLLFVIKESLIFWWRRIKLSLPILVSMKASPSPWLWMGKAL